MRLHTLSMSAFGPFAGTETVDFDALGAGGLFLFHGHTGAGKSSILDAVCFALYGQVPGHRQQARSLRSDHAAPGTRAEVTLEATLRGRRIRVTRAPAWERPKLRGTGSTTEQARVLLQEQRVATDRDDAWTTLSTRLDESGHLLADLLGLSREQFCQVVLLPQGQFAEFLRADADRRRDLLETLFDTGRFATVERWLVDARKSGARALEAKDHELRQVLARVAQVVDVEPDGVLEPAGAARWVAELLRAARRQATGADAAQTAAAAARERGAAALAAALRARDLHSRRDSLLLRQAALEGRLAEQDAIGAELEAARLVAPVLPLLAEVGRLQTELEDARAEALAGHRDLAGFLAATGTTGTTGTTRTTGTTGTTRHARTGPASAVSTRLPSPEEVARCAAATRAEIGGLRRLAEQEAQAQQLRTAVDTLERTVVSLHAESARVAAWLDSADERRDQLVARRSSAQDAAHARAGAADAHARAAARLSAGRRRDELTARVTATEHEARTAIDRQLTAREAWLTLRAARLDGMAAELAGALARGEACPVCGSEEHPAPATAAADAVTRADEDRAARLAGEAEAVRAACERTLRRLEVELAEVRSAAGGTTDLDLLTRDEAAARRHLAALEQAAGDVPSLEAQLAAFDQEREGKVREQVRLEQEAESARAGATERAQRFRQLAAVLDEARREDPSITARAGRLERLADDCERLARQVAELDRLSNAVGGARQRAERAARERDLPSLELVSLAARDEARVVELDEWRRRHDAELATVAELLAEPDLAVVDELPVPDIAAARLAAEEAEDSDADAITAAGAARIRVQALETLHVRVQEVLADRMPLAARQDTVDALSRLAEGKSADNSLRMSLSGYVLAARLEQVAAAASERLAQMSGSRYTLVHRAEPSAVPSRGRGGLTLRVADAWTGVERDCSTLSGGETFFASLSLALGLADVVTAEAGGSLLESLFVDEGFGSLDEETLDEVMDVLDGLRDGGRVVGVVSHVADLRQRIAVQLRVDKGRTGSTVHA